ncbi:MAG: hypothetical protein WB757_00185 [Candidatus Cybelea sp.]
MPQRHLADWMIALTPRSPSLERLGLGGFAYQMSSSRWGHIVYGAVRFNVRLGEVRS